MIKRKLISTNLAESIENGQGMNASKIVTDILNGEHSFNALLSKKQVECLTQCINNSTRDTKVLVYFVYKNKGYKKLKCKDFKSYIETFTSLSYDAAIKQVNAADVAYSIGGKRAIGKFSDASMLAMKKLKEKEINAVIKAIKKTHGESKITKIKLTEEMVKEAIVELGIGSKDKHSPSGKHNKKDTADGTKVARKNKQKSHKSKRNGRSQYEGYDTKTKGWKKTETITDKNADKRSTKKSATAGKEKLATYSKLQTDFLKHFEKECRDNTSSKAIFNAFLKTQSGSKTKTLEKAVKLLTKRLKRLNAKGV
ncbi:hypothetical protein [Shewanella algae]|uniref:hypothetical protein n=1 Tax=Shewanella algae TaxID=38313 RepID=UPI0011833D3D|nr:hypothetical protein [Shewanella algae]TVL16327.1 hypothetical protein AYJ02_06900 [Shewanella algae]